MTETVTFTASAQPPLADGTYTVTVSQDVTLKGTGDPGETLQATVTFAVAGPHYQLAPGLVFRTSPAAQAEGDFATVLPSLSLGDPTLPWQRFVEGPGGKTPWLALLVFDETDPPPEIVTGSIADLQTPDSDVYAPAPVLGVGETSATPLSYIDVPANLFNVIAPSATDIGWLTHVETVAGQTGAQPGQPAPGSAPAPATAAVLIGNRFPVAGRVTTVHLVSLENWGSALAPVPGTLTAPGGQPFVRVASLYHWTFTANSTAATLSAMVGQLSAGTMQRPVTGTGTPPAAVTDALGLGYVAMNHSLRDGSATVSWYRGPLLPQPTAAFAKAPASAASADAWLRYDPTTGLFDTSYAGAFTLGWLLALNNAAYSAAFQRWTLALVEAQAAAAEAQALPGLAPPATPAPPSAIPQGMARVQNLVTRLVAPAAAQIRKSTP